MQVFGRIDQERDRKGDLMALAHDILKKAHPDAVFVIHHLITVVQSWREEVMAWANQVFLFSLEIALLLHLFFFFKLLLLLLQRKQRLKQHLCNVVGGEIGPVEIGPDEIGSANRTGRNRTLRNRPTF